MKFPLLCLVLFVNYETSGAISCNEVINRAKNWSGRKIPYSMSASTSAPGGGSYRTDCSGYVSMAWKLGTSLSTVTLGSVSTRIIKGDLRRGDIVMKGGPGSAGASGHVLIFERWANDARTSYWAFEQTPPRTVHRIITNYPYFGRPGYVPYRYNKITCGGGNPGPSGPSGGCSCCKGNALGEFCGHELCGSGCVKDHIYGCNAKGASPSMRYGNCSKGCVGSSNSKAVCRK